MRSMLLGVAETGLELSPQATEGLFLSCEFCNPSASRRSAPPFTQGRQKVVVVAFATAVQICKCQSFSEGFQPCQHHAIIGLCKPPALPVVMTILSKAFFNLKLRIANHRQNRDYMHILLVNTVGIALFAALNR